MITQLEILSETFLVADMKEPNVCGGQITRDMYQNLKRGLELSDIKDWSLFEKINQANTDVLMGCVSLYTLHALCR